MSHTAQRIALAAQLLQAAALTAAAGWLLSHPAAPLPGRPPPGEQPPVITPGVPTGGAEFATEAEALAAYLKHLDQVFDLETILSGRVDLDALAQARDAARACRRLDCAGLDAYEAQARALGRAVPPKPAWDGAALTARRAVGVYVDDLQRRLEEALPDAPQLIPSEAQRQAARDCPDFDCRALKAYLAVARNAFAVAGQPMPPAPEIKPPGRPRRR